MTVNPKTEFTEYLKLLKAGRACRQFKPLIDEMLGTADNPNSIFVDKVAARKDAEFVLDDFAAIFKLGVETEDEKTILATFEILDVRCGFERF